MRRSSSSSVTVSGCPSSPKPPPLRFRRRAVGAADSSTSPRPPRENSRPRGVYSSAAAWRRRVRSAQRAAAQRTHRRRQSRRLALCKSTGTAGQAGATPPHQRWRAATPAGWARAREQRAPEATTWLASCSACRAQTTPCRQRHARLAALAAGAQKARAAAAGRLDWQRSAPGEQRARCTSAQWAGLEGLRNTDHGRRARSGERHNAAGRRPCEHGGPTSSSSPPFPNLPLALFTASDKPLGDKLKQRGAREACGAAPRAASAALQARCAACLLRACRRTARCRRSLRRLLESCVVVASRDGRAQYGPCAAPRPRQPPRRGACPRRRCRA